MRNRKALQEELVNALSMCELALYEYADHCQASHRNKKDKVYLEMRETAHIAKKVLKKARRHTS